MSYVLVDLLVPRVPMVLEFCNSRACCSSCSSPLWRPVVPWFLVRVVLVCVLVVSLRRVAANAASCVRVLLWVFDGRFQSYRVRNLVLLVIRGCTLVCAG